METTASWEVLTADSGRGILKAKSYQPDAILLDVMMPDMDGFTTFEKLQTNRATQTISVIF